MSQQTLSAFVEATAAKFGIPGVAGGVWAAKQADRFLLDQRRERLDFPRTVEAVKAMSEKWPGAHRKLVEDKANGTAVIATLKHEISGLIAVNPEGGKIARAQAVSPQVESGNVYLPHPAIAPWVDAFIEECAAFPAGKHDDQVDQMSQALNRLTSGRLVFGLNDYYAEVQRTLEQRGLVIREASPFEVAKAAGMAKAGNPTEAGEPDACPSCGATCLAPVASGGWRCGMCGLQGGQPRTLMPEIVNRKAMFEEL